MFGIRVLLHLPDSLTPPSTAKERQKNQTTIPKLCLGQLFS